MRIRKLPVGRAWEALREDEIACRSLGINPTNTKLSAFAIGAMFGGFAGAFFATRQGFISPESFTFIESAVILARGGTRWDGLADRCGSGGRHHDRPARMVPGVRGIPHAAVRGRDVRYHDLETARLAGLPGTDDAAAW